MAGRLHSNFTGKTHSRFFIFIIQIVPTEEENHFAPLGTVARYNTAFSLANNS